MKDYDAVVIGGGVLGCFAARSLCRWKLNIALVEAREDVCTGITRANASVVYAGYDHKPGTRKATFTALANARMDALCRELEVPFSRPGSLMTATGPKGEAILHRKLAQGRAKQVPGLELLTGREARTLEPMLAEDVSAALYAPTTGTVNPWELGIAAFENALENGCTFLPNTPIRAIRREGKGYILQTDGEEIRCRAVLNCAGLYADRVHAMLFPGGVKLKWDASDFLVLDAWAEGPKHILFQETETGKGITAVPTAAGNLLLASPARPMTGEPFATSAQGLQALRAGAAALLPGLDLGKTIRSFGALRPNPYDGAGKSIASFLIQSPEPGFRSLIGIKTPGLTCAEQLGSHLAEQTAQWLNAAENKSFTPNRRAIRRFAALDVPRRAAMAAEPDYRQIVCQCGKVTKGEILEAIARGAVTVDGVKRRVGTGLGLCQGSRCGIEIEKLLRQHGHEVRL